MRGTPAGVLWKALAASGALHGLLAVVGGGVHWTQGLAPASPEAVELTLVVPVTPASARPPPARPVVDPAPTPSVPPRPQRESARRQARPPAASASTPPPTVTPGDRPRHGLPVAAAPELALDPAHVASAALGPPNPAALEGSSDVRDPREEAERRLEEHLALANRAPAERRRPPPRLARHTDGSFTYSGPGFRARIARDGSVSFDDQPGFAYEGYDPSRGPTSLGFRFDLTDAVERARGNDPYYADRQWFMRETRPLRDRLAAGARVEEQAHGDRLLLGRLRRIVQDERRTLGDRHAAIYRIFREGSERTRLRVLRFVREELPRGSEEAFTEAELSALPGFEPYGGPAPAGPRRAPAPE